MLAIKKQDTIACEILMSSMSPPEVNFFHEKMEHSYLAQACLDNSTDIVGILVRAGCNVEFMARGVTNDYPLYIALRQGDCATSKILLDAEADIHTKYKTTNGSGLFFFAILKGNMEILEMLLKRDSSLARTKCGSREFSCNPVTAAASIARLDMMKILVSHGGKIDCWDEILCPLHVAAFIGDVKIIGYLLERGAKANNRFIHSSQLWYITRELTGWQTPLSMACAQGKLEAAMLLLSMGNASPTCEHNLCLKNFAFMEAINKYPIVMNLLLLKGVPLATRCKCHGPCSLLDKAICRGHYNVAALLIAHGATPDWSCHEGTHHDLIPTFSDDLITAMYSAGMANKYSVTCPPSCRAVLQRLHWQLKGKVVKNPDTLLLASIQALRFELQSKCILDPTSTTLWHLIDCIVMPASLKFMLKLKQYVKW